MKGCIKPRKVMCSVWSDSVFIRDKSGTPTTNNLLLKNIFFFYMKGPKMLLKMSGSMITISLLHEEQ